MSVNGDESRENTDVDKCEKVRYNYYPPLERTEELTSKAGGTVSILDAGDSRILVVDRGCSIRYTDYPRNRCCGLE